MRCEQDDELGLISRAQQGDRCALETLMQAYQPMLLALAARLKCMSINREELIQSGCLGFMQALHNYDPEQHTLLTTYAFPWILGEMRRALKSEECSRVSLDEPITAEDSYSLYDVISGEEGVDLTRMDLHLAICNLNHEEQLLICMRYFQDKTQKEAAHFLEKSQTQVSRIERRALDALRAMLND